MRLLLLAIAMLLAVPASAEETLCSSAWVQKLAQCEDIARCAGEARVQSDRELNRLYNELRADLVDPKPLVQAQRSWLAYRKAECEYQSSGYDCESGVSGMCSVERAACQVHLTCERVRQLREHIQEKCNGCPVRKSSAARPNRSFDADVLSAGFAGLLAAGQLRR